MTRDASPFDIVFSEALDRISLGGTGDAVTALLRRIVDGYGLRHAAYLAINLPGLSTESPYIASTYTPQWVMRYREQSYHRNDPVILRGFDSIMPLDWGQIDKSTSRVRRLFGEANEFGIGRHGLSFPIRGRHGERALFTITSDETDRSWMHTRRELMRDFQIIANHVHQFVLTNEALVVSPVHLSPREIDCLQWAASGKTRFEIAHILGLTDRTTAFYLETARHKLNAANTTHAVAKAISMNIVSLGM